MPEVGPELDDDFCQAVGPLTEGGLCFPPPFDLRSTLALAANRSIGALAVRGFHERQTTLPTRYRVLIAEQSEDGQQCREIVDTVVPNPQLLLSLLIQVATELDPDEL
jgi:hypothetical protein